jgi:formate C-acetyltransferase
MIEATISEPARLADDVEAVRAGKRAQQRVDTWFYVQESEMEHRERLIAEGKLPTSPAFQAELLCAVVRDMPLSIPDGTWIVGSQDGAFSPSYALINPSFEVESFAGYCDPTAIYDDIKPDASLGLDAERIERVRQYWAQTPYVQELYALYGETGDETREVVYFVEPVTGHTIPDLRPYLKHGVRRMHQLALESGTEYGRSMAHALEAVLILAGRYRALALELAQQAPDDAERRRLRSIADVLDRVPAGPAGTLREAIQAFVLLWQVMVLEQAPNPYAFSAGNVDRVFEPYYDPKTTSREEAVALIRHFLTFFQVGNRCWAISQNVLVGGRDAAGNDLTSEMTYIVLDAFFASNDPQPALSVKVHRHTPDELYRSLGRFFFTPGHSTPSMFNDDSLFPILHQQGVAEEDLADYAIAGCQEPLIMGKSSLNTTNTWLNLGKVLELATNDGKSLITERQIGPTWQDLGIEGGEAEAYTRLENVFHLMLDRFLPRMAAAGNTATSLLGLYKPVPFTSSVMDSFASWRDMRDPEQPGARYNASGCLIHGLSVVANSLRAVECLLSTGRWAAADLRKALQRDFSGADGLRQFVVSQDKFGNDEEAVDDIAVRIAEQVSDRVKALKNPARRPFLADWSTPSTHLLYGYWCGATPDGRHAREMLGYGVDPTVGTVRDGLPGRMLSAWKLPYRRMTGGYGSHIGISVTAAHRALSLEAGGTWMQDQVIEPLFRLRDDVAKGEAPYYVYFNVDDATHLRQVLQNPEKYAPSGVYIMRIHGTFVNFLDLSPAIQEDIIRRLDLSEDRG